MRGGNYRSVPGQRYGMFRLRLNGARLLVIATDGWGEGGAGWEHVSVSARGRCPTWEEMSWVKELFWDPAETVIQFHPNREVYVNYHPYCLHLWRHRSQEIELPPASLIGPMIVEGR